MMRGDESVLCRSLLYKSVRVCCMLYRSLLCESVLYESVVCYVLCVRVCYVLCVV